MIHILDAPVANRTRSFGVVSWQSTFPGSRRHRTARDVERRRPHVGVQSDAAAKAKEKSKPSVGLERHGAWTTPSRFG